MCDIDLKTCETSKKLKKPDIVELAKKCGIDPYLIGGKKEKTRNVICTELVQRNSDQQQANVVDQTIPANLIDEAVKLDIEYQNKDAKSLQYLIEKKRASLDVKPPASPENRKYDEQQLYNKKVDDLKILAKKEKFTK